MKLLVFTASILLSCLLALPCLATDGVASGPAGAADPILAVVDGVVQIRVSDFVAELATLPDHLKSLAATAEGKKEMMDTMILREMILLEAKKAKIDDDPAVLAKLRELKKRVIVEAFLKLRVEAAVKVTDTELLDFYNKNMDKFTVDDEIRVSLITVDNKELAEGLVTKIKAGESFEDLAKKYSVDTRSSANGGDLGWGRVEDIDPAVAKIAETLEENKLSGVVTSENVYHVFKVTGKRHDYLYPFTEVKTRVKKFLSEAKQQDTFTNVKADLKAKYKVVADDAAIDKLNTSNSNR